MMDIQVIHIFGASGSGTTTLGSCLSQALGYYHMDTDHYFWEETDPPYTVKRAPEDRVALIREEIGIHRQVVLSGSLVGWGDALIPLFSLAIRLNTDTPTRISRIMHREKEKLGPRIAPGGDMFDHHQAFLQWAAAYDDGGMDMRSRQRHDMWQKKLCCRVLQLDGSTPLRDNLDTIVQNITRL